MNCTMSFLFCVWESMLPQIIMSGVELERYHMMRSSV